MTSILLTGAAGRVGGHLARHLVAQAARVTGLLRKPDQARALARVS